MKVTSFFFILSLGALALAHGSPEPHSNVLDLSSPAKWDSSIGKGIPALVELYVSWKHHLLKLMQSQLCSLVVRYLVTHEYSA